jgi:hypothetical protein
MFDWSDENDSLWYYIKDGFMHGPRLIDEIDAMHVAGYLPPETLVCFVAAGDWITIEELVAQSPDEPLEATARDHATEAINALRQGDKIGAGISGFKAIGKIWKDWTAPEAITSEWLCVDLVGQKAPSLHSIIEHYSKAGFSVLDHEFQGNDKDRELCLRFSDAAEAQRARDQLDGEMIGEDFILILSNRKS